jgi:uncharacterized protein
MTRPRSLSTAVAWMPWSGETFARAAAEGRPVLLSIAAGWCDACREMDRTTFADPSVASIVNEQFVPIRVTPDARPDIADRYGLGAWPTTAFLSPDGQLLGGGTFIAVERMPGVLHQVSAAFDAVPAGQCRTPREATQPARLGGPVPSSLDILAAYDAVHGGFGGAPKIPHVAALRLALAGSGAAGRTARDDEIVVRTLDAMGWGGLFDEGEGGFFHYAARADWSAPHAAKRLDDQAALIRLYLDAGEALDLTRFTTRAADTVAFVQSWLADPEGGWYCARHSGSDDADAPAPTALYAGANAAMASAALHAARVLEDDGLRQFALTSLERVLLACYRPGDGVSHYYDGRRRGRGLLAGQVAMAGACLDAHDATGQVPYVMMAEELMHFAVRALWDAGRGAFADRAADADEPAIGLLAEPLYPFAGNCTAAVVLRRLARVSGDQEFTAYADCALAAMAPLAASQGVLAAEYLLAQRKAER